MLHNGFAKDLRLHAIIYFIQRIAEDEKYDGGRRWYHCEIDIKGDERAVLLFLVDKGIMTRTDCSQTGYCEIHLTEKGREIHGDIKSSEESILEKIAKNNVS